jgi:hypothetical protein
LYRKHDFGQVQFWFLRRGAIGAGQSSLQGNSINYYGYCNLFAKNIHNFYSIFYDELWPQSFQENNQLKGRLTAQIFHYDYFYFN